MARPYTCQSFCYSPLFTRKNELASGTPRAHINGNGTLTCISTVFYSFTPAVLYALTFASVPAPSSNSKLFKQFIKAYLRAQIKLASLKAQEKALNRPVKAKNPNLYYENLYIKCYYFCCQCKDYFEMAKGKGYKRVLFAALFLRKRIYFCWQ